MGSRPDRARTEARGRRALRRVRSLVLLGVVGVTALACSSTTDAPSPATAVPGSSVPATVRPGTTSAPATSSTVGGSTVPGPPGTDGAITTTSSAPAPTSTSTTSPVPPASPTTRPGAPVTSVAPASSVPLPGPGVTTAPVALDAQIYWVRPPQEDRTIDLPGYVDPADGSRPLVLYGSATNTTGRPVSDPTARATWVDQAGAPVASFRAPVLRAGSTSPATTLGPGESGDIIIVVTDPATAARLGGGTLVPELVAAGR